MAKANKYGVLYRSLDSVSELTESLKSDLYEFLHEQVGLYRRGNEPPEEIALRLARLMSTSALQAIDDENDPYLSILLIAGQLELPPAHRGSVSWSDLCQRVESLEKPLLNG